MAAGRAGAVLDHLVLTSSGVVLVEERDWPGSVSLDGGTLVRHRTGPGGQWAKCTEDVRLDEVRRLAERAEDLASQPIDPVLVLTAARTSFHGPVLVRGVTVMALEHLPSWLASNTVDVDRVTAATARMRLERASRPADAPSAAHRVPPAALGRRSSVPASTPLRAGAGPRDHHLPLVVSPAVQRCPEARMVRSDRPSGSALVTAVIIAGLLLLAGVTGRALEARSASGAATPGGPPVPAAAAPPAPVVPQCSVLSAEAVGLVTGTPVVQLPSPSGSTCLFGAEAGDATAVVRIDVGESAIQTTDQVLAAAAAAGLPPVPMWTLTYAAASAAPGGSGRPLAEALRIAVHPGLVLGDEARGEDVAEAIVVELLRAAQPAASPAAPVSA